MGNCYSWPEAPKPLASFNTPNRKSLLTSAKQKLEELTRKYQLRKGQNAVVWGTYINILYAGVRKNASSKIF